MPPSGSPASKVNTAAAQPQQDRRLTHLGRLLELSLRRFDARVLALMARDVDMPLRFAHLAVRQQISAAHIHLTRHLALEGLRLTDLARRAGMSKQAMANLVRQCVAWGLVEKQAATHDRRAVRICFTQAGLLWVRALDRALAQAEQEFCQSVGAEVATVTTLALEAYANSYGA